MKRFLSERGISLLETALILTVAVPAFVLGVLIHELQRANSQLRENVTATMAEYAGIGYRAGSTNNNQAKILIESVRSRLQNGLASYDKVILGATLDYQFGSNGDIVYTNFNIVDCQSLYDSECSSHVSAYVDLQNAMLKYLREHKNTLAVHDVDPLSGENLVVTLPGRLGGMYALIKPKDRIWQKFGIDEIGKVIDIVSSRREVYF